jgi:hypothetical protein
VSNDGSHGDRTRGRGLFNRDLGVLIADWKLHCGVLLIKPGELAALGRLPYGLAALLYGVDTGKL